jgi:predicted outer membrane repeat protein
MAGKLLRLCTVVSLLHSANSWLAITSLADSLPNASSCDPDLQQNPPDCNLRSAIAYCLTNHSYLLNDCTILFPTNKSHLVIEDTYGEIQITNATGQISLVGNNCSISGSSLIRLFNISIDSTAHNFLFSLSNLEIHQFGNLLLDGGAIFLDGVTAATLTDITFFNNSAYQGGALSLYSSSNISINNCHFISNLADSGGAVFIESTNSHVHFHQTIFDSNTALSASGGAIHILSKNYNISFSHCLFHFNQAFTTGGAVQILKQNRLIVFSHTSFLKNSVPQVTTINQYGGALYIDNDNIDLQVISCQFLGNTADSAGGVYLGTSNEILFASSSFMSNNVTSNGGGIYFNTENTASIISTNFTHHLSLIGSGAAIFGHSYNHLDLSDVLIASNTGKQGAAITLYQWHSFLNFDRIHFLDNRGLNEGSAGIDLGDYSVAYNFTNCIFEGNVGTLSGGGFNIGTFSSQINFINCRFNGNSADYGGAGFLSLQASEVWFKNCIFQNGTALVAGALVLYSINVWVSFEDCLFINNSADRGGALLILTDSFALLFKRCKFVSNVALESGGVMYLDTRIDSSFEETQFISNRAGVDGGAIFLEQENSLVVLDSIFEGNQATNGGAIAAINHNSALLIQKTLFSNNSGSVNGGAVVIKDSNENIEIAECVFESNVAGRAGGAISIQSDNLALRVHKTLFLQNIASSAGGGIYSALANHQLQIIESTFTKNVARYGGGVYIGDYHDPLYLSASMFSSNLAEYGSGLYISPFNANALINQTDFAKNIAVGRGAGLMSYASPLILRSCKFTTNIALSSSSGYLNAEQILMIDVEVVNGLSSGDTGGLFLEDATDLQIHSSTFRNNSGTMGGGLSISSCLSITLKDSYFIFNHGVEMAGALWIELSLELIIDNSSFIQNRAPRGGAVGINLVDSFDLNNSYFEKNLASQDAGGVLFNNGMAIIKNTTFTRNMATDGSGSAMYLIATQSYFSQNRFINNSALQGAGTVYWQYRSLMPKPVELTTNIFLINEAAYGPDFATEGTKLFLSQGNQYEVTDYTRSIPPLVMTLQDDYQQTIRTESSSVVDLSILQQYECYDHNGYISGGVIDQMENGTANFTSLDAYCAPGYSMTILAQSSIDNDIPSVNFTLSFRACTVGEYYNGYSCQLCETGTYSLLSYSSLDEMSQIEVCQRCPSEADTCYGSTMDLKSGFWRLSESSDVIFACPTGTAGCQGGNESGNGLCHEGYHGPLCSLCDDGYGLSKSTYTCIRCRETNGFDEIAIIFFLFIGLFLLSVLWYQFHPAAKKIHNFEDFILLVVKKCQRDNRTDRTSTPRELIQSARVMSKRLFARLKVYITLYQILSVLPFVLNMTFPNPLSFFIYCWKFLSGTMSDSTLPACNTHSYDFIDSLVVETISPLIVVLLIFGARSLHLLSHSSRASSETDPTPLQGSLSKTKAIYFTIFLVWTYLILPAVSATIFQTFRSVSLPSFQSLSLSVSL